MLSFVPQGEIFTRSICTGRDIMMGERFIPSIYEKEEYDV